MVPRSPEFCLEKAIIGFIYCMPRDLMVSSIQCFVQLFDTWVSPKPKLQECFVGGLALPQIWKCVPFLKMFSEIIICNFIDQTSEKAFPTALVLLYHDPSPHSTCSDSVGVWVMGWLFCQPHQLSRTRLF